MPAAGRVDSCPCAFLAGKEGDWGERGEWKGGKGQPVSATAL